MNDNLHPRLSRKQVARVLVLLLVGGAVVFLLHSKYQSARHESLVQTSIPLSEQQPAREETTSEAAPQTGLVLAALIVLVSTRATSPTAWRMIFTSLLG